MSLASSCKVFDGVNMKALQYRCPNCSNICKSFTFHIKENPNRRYYKCDNRVEDCSWFGWCDEIDCQPIDIKYKLENVESNLTTMFEKKYMALERKINMVL